MSRKLEEQIRLELEQLNSLLEFQGGILARRQSADPDSTEVAALAAILHSFYTGIENIFKRVALELDGTAPSGLDSHSALLDSMASSNACRDAVVSQELRSRLKEYLQFRHFFRYAYSFLLRWDRMSPLVLNSPQTLRLLEAELNAFLARLP